MPINTRAQKREPVDASCEYTIDGSADKCIKLNIPIVVKSGVTQCTTIKSSLLDISVTGCAIDSPYLIPPGITLHISIDAKPFVTAVGTEQKVPIKVTGTVTSSIMKSQGHYRLGVKFTRIEKEDKDLISQFIISKSRPNKNL